ncbi:MAG: EAL domain-containing protein [Alphaproteobacteria bacterium]|nr:EAL domain-containing protein [Alphaproteobacteria bacterium]
MTSDKDIRDQRDRFLGFAFAGADLMLEVDSDGTIVFAAGAARGLTGATDGKLTGKNVSEIFAPRDRGLIGSLRASAKPGLRFGPVLVNLNEEQTNLRKAMLSGVAMPDKPGTVYLTIAKGALSQVSDAKSERATSESALLDKETFAEAAMEMMAASDTLGQKLAMTFVDLPDTKNFKGKIGSERWASFKDNISTMLRTYAADGRTAAALDDGRFGLVHGENITPDAIQKNIEAMSRDIDPEKKGVTATAKAVDLSDDTLSERELARAVMYTINQFEKQGSAFNILNLEGGFENFLAQNAQKISDFKQIINQSRFDLKFQPIINMKDGSVAYYEALVRFADGKSPYDAIVFCEDVGLSPELDLAICGKVINYLVFNAPNKQVKISVNLSGVSVQNERFVEKLRNKLEPHLKSDIPKRMIFEITESSQINDLDKVNSFVRALQDDGFKVSLDDFGAGSASFQYLHKIHVDSVKIDGQYIMNILTSQRDQAMISNLVRMCSDLKVGVVAERVETKEHVDLLKKMGVEMGQGYYFAKPLDAPTYQAKAI